MLKKKQQPNILLFSMEQLIFMNENNFTLDY